MSESEEDKKSKEEKIQIENIEKLSKELFNKPSKDIKYLYVTNYIHRQLLEEELARTGLYQWLNVFDGEVHYPRDVKNYNDYDIVQVNLSAQDVHLVNTIREILGEESKTKLVANNDYTTEAWGNAFEYTPTLEREIRGADMLFGTEYFQTTALSELSGRECFIIPHPGDIKRLKSLPRKAPQNIISTIWRRYDKHVYIPSLVTRNHGLTTRLIGFDKAQGGKVYLTTTLFDVVLGGTNYFEFCDQLSESKVIYDPFTFHSYSRATIDTAALRVPVVASNRTQSGNLLYPHTCVDPYDVKSGRELIDRILKDEEFRKLVIDTAYEKCEHYNHLNSKERYLTALVKGSNFFRKGKVNQPTLVKGSGDDVLTLLANDVTRENYGKKKTEKIIK